MTDELPRIWASNDCDVADDMPPELRSIVHEYGLSVVRAFLDCGVTKANRIRHMIHAVHLGAREYSNIPTKSEGCRRVEQQIDDLLTRMGAGPQARLLLRELQLAGYYLMPVSRCSKTDIKVAWPWLLNK